MPTKLNTIRITCFGLATLTIVHGLYTYQTEPDAWLILRTLYWLFYLWPLYVFLKVMFVWPNNGHSSLSSCAQMMTSSLVLGGVLGAAPLLFLGYSMFSVLLGSLLGPCFAIGSYALLQKKMKPLP